jgi:mRNA interferase MazF
MVKRGDIIWLDFDPQSGTEQSGRRPAVVISNATFHHISKKRAIVCPITSTDKDYPIHIRLDERTKTNGVVLSDQIRVVDLLARNFKLIESIPEDLLQKIVDITIGFVE